MGEIPGSALLALIALQAASCAGGPRDEESERVAAFEARTGAWLVFDAEDLPDGNWLEIKRELPPTRRARAAQIALSAAEQYPPGYFGAIGVKVVGIFDGLASTEGDGHHPWDEGLGGYRYFGEWNGRDAVIGAFYSED